MTLFFLFLISAFISGGVNYTFVKFGVSEISPLVFIFLRFSIASLIVFFFWVRKREVIKKEDLVKIFPFAINVILFSYGLKNTTLLAGGIIALIIPILVAILGHYLLNEKLLRNHIIGLILALAGVSFFVLESLEKQNALSFGSTLGNLTIVISSTSFAFYTVGVKKLSKKYSSVAILFFTFLIPAIISGILAPIELITHTFDPAKVNFVGVVSVIVLSVAAVIFYFLYQWFVKHISAFVASLVIYAALIFTSLSGILFFGEEITLKFVFGSAFILLGVFYATTYGYIKK